MIIGLVLMAMAVADPPPAASEPDAGQDAGTAELPTPDHRTVVSATALLAPGSSTAVVSRGDIESLPGGDSLVLSDVLATQAGVVRDTFGIELFHIHGFENGVLYELDGIPIAYGAAESFSDVIPTRLLERVTLMTGGMPVEYGAQAGVIDMTSRRPGEQPEGDVQLVYGTYNTIEPSVNYSQSFGKLDLLVGGNYLGTQYGLNPPQVTPIVHDAETAGNAFAKVDFRASAQDRFELLGEFSLHNYQIPIDTTILPLSEAPPGAVRGTDAYGNSPPVFVPYNANPTEWERDLFTALSYVHSADRGTLQISPYFRYSTLSLNCDPAGSLGPTADPDTSCTDLGRQVLHEGVSTTYAWHIGTHHRLKAGLVIDDAQESLNFSLFTNQGSIDGGPNPNLTQQGADDINVLQGGVFLQDEITVGKATFFPGLRVDLENGVYNGSAHLPNLFLVGPTAKLGFQYAFTDALALHAFAGYIWTNPQTLDAPIAAAALENIPGPLPASENLKAERDEEVEVGLSYHNGRRLKVNLTVWGRMSQDTIDWQPVGSSLLLVNFNWAQGRAVGADLSANFTANRYLTGFANVSPQIAQGEGIASAQYLFTIGEQLYQGWSMLDHSQYLTMNAGADLHDEAARSHVSVLVQYGSGLHTGPDLNETVPPHCTINATVRHRLDFLPLHPEVAVDVLNLLNEAYALRIANGYFDGAYAPLRRVMVRLIVPWGE